MLLPKKSKKSKKEQNFYCVCCDFSTSKKSNYDRHLTTQKHLKKSLPIITKSLPKKSKKEPKSVKIFVCENCNKEYKSYKGLWGHKKKCVPVISKTDEEVQKWKMGFIRKSYQAGVQTVFGSFKNLPAETCYACQADEEVLLGSPEKIFDSYS